MPLHLDYRPTTFEDFTGNRPTVNSLIALLEREDNDFPHSLIFTGPSGCGKTTLARIVAKRLDCSDYDLRELNIADFRGIDTIRDIRRQVELKPLGGNARVWILDEVHKLSNDAQNALLKLLEDTPSHVYFLLCTTDPQKLLKTILSRCMEFKVSSLSENRLKRLLRHICVEEKKEVPEEIIKKIAEVSQGHPRMALVVLDKIIDLPETKMEHSIDSVIFEENKAIELCRALIEGKLWKEVSEILKGLKGEDPEQVRRAVLGYCSSVLLNKDDAHAFVVMDQFASPLYDIGFPGLVMACYLAVEGISS